MPTLTTFVLAAALAAGPAAPLPKLAVLRLKALDPTVTADTELLVEVILADLAASHRVDAIGASDIEAMLGVERQRQLLGCSDASSSCLAELGGATTAAAPSARSRPRQRPPETRGWRRQARSPRRALLLLTGYGFLVR